MNKNQQLLNGRQMAWLIYKHYARTDAERPSLEFNDLLRTELTNSNLTQFLNTWDHILLGVTQRPEDFVLHSLLIRQLERCDHFSAPLTHYKMGVQQGHHAQDYSKLLSIARIHKEDREKRRIQPEPTYTHGATPADTASKGDCRSWMSRGSCSRGDACPFAHMLNKRGPKPRGRSPSQKGTGARPKGKGKGTKGGDDARGRSASRPSNANSVRGKSPSGKADQKLCSFFLKGNCNKGDACDFYHARPCKNFAAGKCKKGDDCQFLHFPRGRASPANGEEATDDLPQRRRNRRNQMQDHEISEQSPLDQDGSLCA